MYFESLTVDHCHMDRPTCMSAVAPPPLTPRPCMHRPVEQKLRRAVTVRLWLLPEREGVQGKWGTRMKEQKAEDKLTCDEKWRRWKSWKWRNYEVGCLWWNMSCMSWNWLKEQRRNMLTEGKIRGTRYPSTLLPLHPSVVFIDRPWTGVSSCRADTWAKMASWHPFPPSCALVALHWFHLLPWPKDCVYINQVICTG